MDTLTTCPQCETAQAFIRVNPDYNSRLVCTYCGYYETRTPDIHSDGEYEYLKLKDGQLVTIDVIEKGVGVMFIMTVVGVGILSNFNEGVTREDILKELENYKKEWLYDMDESFATFWNDETQEVETIFGEHDLEKILASQSSMMSMFLS